MKPREFGPRIFYRQSLINEGVVIMTMMAWLGVVIIIVFSLFERCPLVTSNEGFGSTPARVRSSDLRDARSADYDRSTYVAALRRAK